MLISEKLHNSLRDKYSPEGSTLRIAQLRMLEELVWFDKVMEENNIPYWLDSGTLLGAIRHDGFIPWDDDVDICILSEDRKKVQDVFMREKNTQFVIQCSKTDRYCFMAWDTIRDIKSQYVEEDKGAGILHNYKKYQGLQIDLFPMSDRVNDNIKKIVSTFDFASFFSTRSGRFHRSVIVKKIALFIFKVQSSIWRLLPYLVSRKNYYTYNYGLNWKHKLPKNIIFPLTTATFEGYTFPVPQNPDAYLKIIYGDYKEIPAKITMHEVNEYKILD